MLGRCVKLAVIGFGLFVASAYATAAGAAELKIWTARAIATVLDQIGPQFEQTTGHKLAVTTGVPGQFIPRINAGENFDVLVLSSAPVDD